MRSAVPRPDTTNKLRFAADAAFAMLAAMQLDVFTPLQGGPKTAEDIAHAIGVGSARLRILMYSLVAGGLLTEKHGRFSNTLEADQFLVKGGPFYIGGLVRNRQLRGGRSPSTDIISAHSDEERALKEGRRGVVRKCLGHQPPCL